MQKRKKEKGQSIVEFALILPFLLLVLCGIIDFGWILSCQNELTNAAGETARYAAIYAGNDNVESLTETFLSEQGITGTPTLVSLTIDDTFATVEVSEQVNFLTGMTGVFFRKNYVTLKGKASMPIEPYETEEDTEETEETEEIEETEKETIPETSPVEPETTVPETTVPETTVPETSPVETETEKETEPETTAPETTTAAETTKEAETEAASGSIKFTTKMPGMKMQITPTNTWRTDSGDVYYQINITISNTTSTEWGTSWTCGVDFGTKISNQVFWGPSTTLSGTVISFKPADQWNGNIGANGSYSFSGQILLPAGTTLSDITID